MIGDLVVLGFFELAALALVAWKLELVCGRLDTMEECLRRRDVNQEELAVAVQYLGSVMKEQGERKAE